MLVKGGGHAMAAGVTSPPRKARRIPRFSRIARLAASSRRGARATRRSLVDAALTAAGATLELYAALERAGPYGAGNPEPVFVFPAHRLVDVGEVGQGHLRWRAKSGDGASIEGILFRAAANRSAKR